jgi:endonuclease/exonuclease/phosphatase family metal-dependent hydrolase
MAKCVCNGIFFIQIYLNKDFEENRHKIWKYIQELVNQNKKVCVMGDFNRFKQDNVRILTHMGMVKVNENDN